MERKQQKICLVSFFVHKAFFLPLSHIREIIVEICPNSDSILTVSPELADTMIFDSGKDDIIIYKNQIRPVFRLINYLILNLKISWIILLRSKDIDSFLFFMETGLPLPMTMVKLRNKRIIWLLPSSLKKLIEHQNDVLNKFLLLSQSFCYYLVDKLVLYSPNLIDDWHLQKYSGKIVIARHHFINSDTHAAITPLNERPLVIGYIGRLSEEKGAQKFVQALPALLNDRKDLSVFIGGNGPLKEGIEFTLGSEGIGSRVDLHGWISEDSIPEYLNKCRLLVLPSYTEGLPNIMLQAMTCCTPILATPVGAIPDIIKDGETGFIMKNNFPACIAANILRALEDPNLEKIAMNAKKIVDKEFTFNNTVYQWKKILNEI